MNEKNVSFKIPALITAILIIVMCIAYYFFIYVPTDEKMTRLNSDIAETDNLIELEKSKAVLLKNKEPEIKLGKESGSTVYDYDKAEAELTFLSGIMKEALNYDFSFSEPVTKDGVYVRRKVTVSFIAESYSAARSVIDKIIDSPYRTVFENFSINPLSNDKINSLNDLGIYGNSRVKVVADLVFIESCKNVDNRTGLKDLSPLEEYEKKNE